MSSQPTKTSAEITAAYERRKMQSLSNRRRFVPGCADCERNERAKNGIWHDASSRCRCGFFEHCTCEVCL